MRAFIDTSSLFKKYVEEEGSDEFQGLLEKVSEIVVSPVCWIEIHAIIFRLVHEKKMSMTQAEWLQREIRKDFDFFSKVIWGADLEREAVGWVKKNALKTLDAVQLASGYLAKTDLFITSDQRLFNVAKRILKGVHFI
ncbi:MAG: type II toxin-antitoxin system VapC family toxin [Chlamydiae bacterium]|nr:type II toxin-antitoxin system VapC family toxin [Chlamydiota bacterium]